MLPAKLGSILPSNFKGEDFFKQELPLAAIFVGGTERNGETLVYRGPYIDAYCQVWFHLAKLFQRRRLKYEKVNERTMDAKWWPGELKNDEKRAITPRRVIRFTSKLQGL